MTRKESEVHYFLHVTGRNQNLGISWKLLRVPRSAKIQSTARRFRRLQDFNIVDVKTENHARFIARVILIETIEMKTNAMFSCFEVCSAWRKYVGQCATLKLQNGGNQSSQWYNCLPSCFTSKQISKGNSYAFEDTQSNKTASRRSLQLVMYFRRAVVWVWLNGNSHEVKLITARIGPRYAIVACWQTRRVRGQSDEKLSTHYVNVYRPRYKTVSEDGGRSRVVVGTLIYFQCLPTSTETGNLRWRLPDRK